MNLLLTFIILNIINVILQTTRGICTIKCGKTVASLVNAIAYGVYTYVIFFTTIDGIGLFTKAIIVAVCNFIGVYGVKWIEQRAQKERLWKIETTFEPVYEGEIEDIKKAFDGWGIPNNYIIAGPYVIFNLYCYTREQTDHARMVISDLGGKYFVSEARARLL